MPDDSKSLQREAVFLYVDYKKAAGTPPSYPPDWQPVFEAGIDSVTINTGSKSSTAAITLPSLRWHQRYAGGLTFGDRILIYKPSFGTSRRSGEDAIVIFSGFIVRETSECSGGSDRSAGYERCSYILADHRWLLGVGTYLAGQYIRGVDNYNNFGSADQYPYPNSCTWLSGRRCVFNASSKPNADPVLMSVTASDVFDNANINTAETRTHNFTIFSDDNSSTYWTARAMISYITSPFINRQYLYAPLHLENMFGLEDEIFDTVLNDISVDGLNLIEALDAICSPLGVSYREQYAADGSFELAFFKLGQASSKQRDSDNLIINHTLYAPDVGENITDAVADGQKLIKTASLDRDISSSVNRPVGLGSKVQVEFTAELVPAWLDEDVQIDSSDDYENLFVTDSQIRDMTAPNDSDFYKYHHTSGSSYRPDVCRKFALNETGRYSVSPSWQQGRNYPAGFIVRKDEDFYRCKKSHLSDSNNSPASANWEQLDSDYDRGKPFDFSNIIDKRMITDANGNRMLAAIKKQILPSLTLLDGSGTSAGVLVEFSFNGGSSWQPIPCSIMSLGDEFGIHITEPNLANIAPAGSYNNTISEGPLEDVPLNLFTSIADDIVNERVFKTGGWKTRVRVTASVQLDNRVYYNDSAEVPGSGSPFNHYRVYDFSSSYGLNKRSHTSRFTTLGLGVAEYDHTSSIQRHLRSIKNANKSLAASGVFIMERLWLDDGKEIFKIGDCIGKIDGRDFDIISSIDGGDSAAVEIVQIVYQPENQTQTLVTRDLKLARPSI